MISRKALIAVLLIVVVLGSWWYLQIDRDARAIRKQFDELVELVEKDGPISSFEAIGRSQKIKAKFTERLLVEYLPGRALPRERDALGGAFLSALNQVDSISVRVSRHDVDVDEDGMEAESSLVANCSLVMNGSERMGDTIDYLVFWAKQEGEWLIERLIATGKGSG